MSAVKCVPITDNNWHTVKEIPEDGSLIQYGSAETLIVNPNNVVKVDYEDGKWSYHIRHWRYWRAEYANTVINRNRMTL